MAIYKNAKITTVAIGDDEVYESDCIVKIGNSQCVVEYDYQGCHYTYSGEEDGEGHYHLKCDSVNGSATLHCFSNSVILEGYWQENAYHGFWRIRLI